MEQELLTGSQGFSGWGLCGLHGRKVECVFMKETDRQADISSFLLPIPKPTTLLASLSLCFEELGAFLPRRG